MLGGKCVQIILVDFYPTHQLTWEFRCICNLDYFSLQFWVWIFQSNYFIICISSLCLCMIAWVISVLPQSVHVASIYSKMICRFSSLVFVIRMHTLLVDVILKAFSQLFLVMKEVELLKVLEKVWLMSSQVWLRDHLMRIVIDHTCN
jgi:hypothetical protein